jgi:predicted alpha/beta-hydrolase family hydrolase
MRLDIPTPAGPALADIDRPGGAAVALLVLTHGAGGGVESADVNAVRGAALKAGIAVVRLTQPYRVAGRRSPPTPPAQDAAWLAALAAVRRRRGFARLPLVVGGRSNGARVACRTAVASGAVAVVGLAFPLHPPGRPDATRLPELDGAGVPVLVVQGDRDPFGMPPPGPLREVLVIAGADHALRRELATVARAVTDFVTTVARHATVG